MPIVFDNVGGSASTGTALAFNFTAAANTVLLVFTRANASRSVSAIAYGGVALTRITQTGFVQEVWGLTAPASGSNILSAQWAGAAVSLCMIAVTYLNVAAVNPWGTPQSNASTGTVFTLSLSSTTTDLVVVGFGINGVTLTINNATTRLTAGAASILVVADAPGAATISISASAGNSGWRGVGVPLVFSAAAVATGSFTLNLLGVGL